MSSGSASRQTRQLPLTFDVQTTLSVPLALVVPTGQLDAHAVPQLRRALRELPEDVLLVILDLRELSACDPSGVRGIDDANAEAMLDGTRLVVVPGSAQVRQAFDAAGIDGHLEFATDPRQVAVPSAMWIVSFRGGLSEPGFDALADAGAEHPGHPADGLSHRVWIDADDAEDAVRRVSRALAQHGTFTDFAAVTG